MADLELQLEEARSYLSGKSPATMMGEIAGTGSPSPVFEDEQGHLFVLETSGGRLTHKSMPREALGDPAQFRPLGLKSDLDVPSSTDPLGRFAKAATAGTSPASTPAVSTQSPSNGSNATPGSGTPSDLFGAILTGGVASALGVDIKSLIGGGGEVGAGLLEAAQGLLGAVKEGDLSKVESLLGGLKDKILDPSTITGLIANLGIGAIGSVLSGMVDDKSSAGAQVAAALGTQALGALKGELTQALTDAVSSALGLGGGAAAGGKGLADRLDEFFNGATSTANIPVAFGLPATGTGQVLVGPGGFAKMLDQAKIPKPNDVGPIIDGNPTVLINSMPAAGLGHRVLGLATRTIDYLGPECIVPNVLMGAAMATAVVPAGGSASGSASAAGSGGAAAGSGSSGSTGGQGGKGGTGGPPEPSNPKPQDQSTSSGTGDGTPKDAGGGTKPGGGDGTKPGTSNQSGPAKGGGPGPGGEKEDPNKVLEDAAGGLRDAGEEGIKAGTAGQANAATTEAGKAGQDQAALTKEQAAIREAIKNTKEEIGKVREQIPDIEGERAGNDRNTSQDVAEDIRLRNKLDDLTRNLDDLEQALAKGVDDEGKIGKAMAEIEKQIGDLDGLAKDAERFGKLADRLGKLADGVQIIVGGVKAWRLWSKGYKVGATKEAIGTVADVAAGSAATAWVVVGVCVPLTASGFGTAAGVVCLLGAAATGIGAGELAKKGTEAAIGAAAGAAGISDPSPNQSTMPTAPSTPASATSAPATTIPAGSPPRPTVCFDPATLVLTPTGCLPIGSLRAGDAIMCMNPDGIIVPGVVEQTSENLTSEILEVVAGGETIRTTARHRWHVMARGWVAAEEMEIGDLLRTSDGATSPITDLQRHPESTPVWNLHVSPHHNFFVGRGTFLVHNGMDRKGNMEKFPR